MRLTREVGFTNHEFCADVLDPFFSGDREFQLEMARAIKQAAREYGVTITDYYTGVATHRFHGLSHSHPAARARMKQWITDAMDIALEMGTDRIGGHWDAIPVEMLQDPKRHQAALENIYQQFRDLAVIAQQKGIKSISQEQMYIPSEVPWTLEQAEQFLIEVNRDHPGVPIYLTIDVGHQAGQSYGLSGPDLLYTEWLKRFAAVSEVVHLQQTTPDASCHWPFTEEYNRQGHVKIEKVIDAIRYSHQHFPAQQAAEQPIAQYLQPVDRTYLIAEIIPSSTKDENTLLAQLKETSDYLHQFIPLEGLEFSV